MDFAKKYDYLCTLFGKTRDVSNVESIQTQIEEYFEIFGAYDPAISQISNEKRIFNEYLRRGGLKVDPKVINEAFHGDDNVFEIYDVNHNQVYRSISFMLFTTYPLFTLMTKSNFELYAREDGYAEQIQSEILSCVENLRKIHFTVPAHKVWEIYEMDTPSCYWRMKLGICAPVLNEKTGALEGVLISHNTRQVFDSPFKRPPLELVP